MTDSKVYEQKTFDVCISGNLFTGDQESCLVFFSHWNNCTYV